ncbi:MAG: hypothetical protein ABI876_14845 [Bacteroidota bacterium]
MKSPSKISTHASAAPRIAVKFRDPVPPPSNDYGALRSFLQSVGVASGTLRMLPLVESLDKGRLGALIDRAVAADPTYRPANFQAWQQAICPDDVDADKLADAFRQLDQVETVYVMKPSPPPVFAADDPRSTNQGYLNPAWNGIDARYAWNYPGGDGAGAAFIDIEMGWNLHHEDLAAANITLVSGVNQDYFYHGTGMLGIVRMVDNTVGGVGIAPASGGRVVSAYRTPNNYNPADAIIDAASRMAFGDVMMIQLEMFDPAFGPHSWPLEIYDINYDAIRLTTALGIIVVEPAGNGSRDLDAYTNPAGRAIFDRSSPDFRDSFPGLLCLAL